MNDPFAQSPLSPTASSTPRPTPPVAEAEEEVVEDIGAEPTRIGVTDAVAPYEGSTIP